MVIVLIVFN